MSRSRSSKATGTGRSRFRGCGSSRFRSTRSSRTRTTSRRGWSARPATAASRPWSRCTPRRASTSSTTWRTWRACRCPDRSSPWGGASSVTARSTRRVTLDAPPHGELRSGHRHARQVRQVVDDVLARLGVHLLHGLDAAVAGLALQPRRDVVLVRELRVLRNLEDPHPRNRLLPVPVALELLDLLIALRGHDLVAAHTFLHRRQPGVAASPRAAVAVLAG